MFSVRVSDYQGSQTLNMCDAGVLGTTVEQGDLAMEISRGYYGQRLVGAGEAAGLLRASSIINMVGEETVSLSLRLGIGSEAGVRRISGVPFLIVFKT